MVDPMYMTDKDVEKKKETKPMEEMSILEYSACGNRQSAYKLKFRGNLDLKSLIALKKMLENKSWDLISVRDIPYRSLERLEPELRAMDYRMVIDPTWKAVKEKYRYTCLSVVFIKKGIKFSQIAGYSGFDTVLRYVCGTFKFNGHDIIYRTSHVPCVDDTRPKLSHQIERKERMLGSEIEFQNEHLSDCCISSGDYNGSADEDCYCQELFDEFSFTDLISAPTYEEKKLDHVYVSNGFKSAGISVEAEVLDDYYMQFTDHKMIAITLKVG